MAIPEKIGHYRILRILGTGGMGEVYLAEDVRLGRHVALKILPREALEDPDRRAAFHQEARAISALSHPNIITIFEIGSDQSFEYLATELVDGETLRDLPASRAIGIGEVVEIGVAVASALVAAHEVGIIHRDIKPENVMLRRDGLVKVLDFGVAKLATGRQGPKAEVFGTIPYVSPEQLEGREGDARSDVWALGVLLYELLAGEPPWNAESAMELRKGIAGEPPRSLRRIDRDIPVRLESVVMRCLAREPAERYQSAGDLAADLKEIQRELATRRTRGRHARAGSARPDERTRGGEGGRPAVPAGIAASILVAFLAAVVWLTVQRNEARAYEKIAILPFENRTGDEANAFLADGLTESLIHRLSTRSLLRVTARSSAYRYQGSDRNPRQIGRELGVDAVLGGSLDGQAGELVIRAELVDVVEGSRLWTGVYRKEETDLLDFEREIAGEIAEQLRVALEAGPDRGTRSPAAHRYYLQGRYEWNQRTRESFEEAIELFEKAIEIDPSYAAAHAGIADVYNLLGTYGDRPPGDSFPRAKAAALRAVELDPTLPEAHTSLAYVLQNYDWDWREAEREYRRALQLNPSYATAHHWYGGFLMLMGRFEEAIDHRKRAVSLDPLSAPIYAALGSPFFLARDYDRAIEIYSRSVRMDPNYARGHFGLGWAYLHKGDAVRGMEEIEIARKLSGGGVEAEADLAYASAKVGDAARAERILRDLRQRSRRHYIDPYEFARVETALGDHDAAFADLERAFALRSNLILNLKVDPSLDPLRGDLRFRDLLVRMNLAE